MLYPSPSTRTVRLLHTINPPLHTPHQLYFLVMPNGDGTFNQTQVDEGYTLDVEDDEGYIMSRDQRIPADSETYQEWEEAEIECLQVKKLPNNQDCPHFLFSRLA